MKKKIFFLFALCLLLVSCKQQPNVVEAMPAFEAGDAFNPQIAAQYAQAEAGDGWSTYLGLPLFTGWESLSRLAVRFLFNLLFCWIIVQFFYYRKTRKRDFYLTFMLFNTTMFMIICLMKNVEMSIALTLGLFAVFGMIRYRTETLPHREMTYLFVITGMAVMNGLVMAVSIAELLLANLLFIAVVALFETVHFTKTHSTKLVLYDKIDLIVPERRAELVADLEKRIGIKVKSLEVGHVDFLRDVAYIKVTYVLEKGTSNTIDELTKAKNFVG